MKNTKLLAAAMAALVVAVGAMIFLTREPATAPPTSIAEPAPAETPARSLLPVTASPAVAQTPIKMPVAQKAPATTDPSVLATVNGVPITAKDLAPGGGAQPPQSLAAQAMLDRAIDQELIMQAATAQGVRLTPEQQQALANLPEGVANTGALDGGKAPEAEMRLQAEIDYRAREATAQFLLSGLTQSPGGAAPESISAQEQRSRQYLDGLRAAAKIEIPK